MHLFSFEKCKPEVKCYKLSVKSWESYRALKIPFSSILYYFIYLRFTYENDANTSVTEKIVKEVRGNNLFSETDIHGKSKLEFILL